MCLDAKKKAQAKTYTSKILWSVLFIAGDVNGQPSILDSITKILDKNNSFSWDSLSFNSKHEAGAQYSTGSDGNRIQEE